jgi:hypothetical protein
MTGRTLRRYCCLMGPVILRRHEAATGEPTVLVETGKTFEAPASPTNGRGTGDRYRSRAGAYTAEVRGSNPLNSTRKSAQTDMISYGTG